MRRLIWWILLLLAHYFLPLTRKPNKYEFLINLLALGVKNVIKFLNLVFCFSLRFCVSIIESKLLSRVPMKSIPIRMESAGYGWNQQAWSTGESIHVQKATDGGADKYSWLVSDYFQVEARCLQIHPLQLVHSNPLRLFSPHCPLPRHHYARRQPWSGVFLNNC